MPISFVCPHCHTKMSIPDKFKGVDTKCPACGEPITITGEPVPKPVQPEKVDVSDASTAWYSKMTGEYNAADKTALDEIHRDVDVDVSEIVTRWDGSSDDKGDFKQSSFARPDVVSPALTPKRKGSPSSGRVRHDRPHSRTRNSELDIEESSGKMKLYALVAGLIIVAGIVAIFVLTGDKKKTAPSGKTEAAISGETPSVQSSSPSNQPVSPVNAATPEPEPSPTEAKTPSPDEIAAKNLLFGDDEFNRMEFKKAAGYYRKYLEHNDKKSEVWAKLAECYIKMNCNDKALEIVDKGLVASGDGIQLLRIKVNLLAEIGLISKIFDAYDKLISFLTGNEKQELLLEAFMISFNKGADGPNKKYLDKSWGYLKQLKEFIDADEFEEYKEALQEAYAEAKFDAPF